MLLRRLFVLGVSAHLFLNAADARATTTLPPTEKERTRNAHLKLGETDIELGLKVKRPIHTSSTTTEAPTTTTTIALVTTTEALTTTTTTTTTPEPTTTTIELVTEKSTTPKTTTTKTFKVTTPKTTTTKPTTTTTTTTTAAPKVVKGARGVAAATDAVSPTETTVMLKTTTSTVSTKSLKFTKGVSETMSTTGVQLATTTAGRTTGSETEKIAAQRGFFGGFGAKTTTPEPTSEGKTKATKATKAAKTAKTTDASATTTVKPTKAPKATKPTTTTTTTTAASDKVGKSRDVDASRDVVIKTPKTKKVKEVVVSDSEDEKEKAAKDKKAAKKSRVIKGGESSPDTDEPVKEVEIEPKGKEPKPKITARGLSPLTEKKAYLSNVEAYDNNGESLRIEDVDATDPAVKQCLVNPSAEKVTFNPSCADGQKLFVNGKKYGNGADVTIKRDKTRPTQIIEMMCQLAKKKEGTRHEQKYAMLVNSDWPEEDIKPPRLVLDELGAECEYNAKKERFDCPDPKTEDKKVRLMAYTEPTIKYVLSNRDKSVDLRLGDKTVTPPFKYGGSFKVSATAGENTKEWPVSFGGSIVAGLLNGLGWLLALLLALLMFALLCVVGLASITGLGVPLGATEIAAGLTVLIQYLSFSNFLRGTTQMESLATPLKWVTMFWPTPFKSQQASPRQLLATTHFSAAYGVRLWGDSSLGDITDIRNAWGCIFWCAVALALVVLVHLFVYIKFAIIEKNYTFPHRARFGNWESRALHWLTFPLAVASMMTLLSDQSSVVWKVGAGCALGVLVIWIGTVFFSVARAVSNLEVCWIWNSSVRQAGVADDLSGYWADVTSDQLLTQPVNRSLCASLFPYQWISTVADIVPVSLSQALFANSSSSSKSSKQLYAPDKMHRAHLPASYPLAKNPQVVEVVRARANGCCFQGKRLIGGLLRTKWLDILMTYQALTRFHSSSVKEQGSSFTVPLIVKTAQLSGPITHGHNAFFYDGARVPFIRIADAIYRLAIGLCVGAAIVSDVGKSKAILFGVVAALSLLFAIYVAVTNPYSRKCENYMTVAMLAVIGCTAFAFIFYALKEQTLASDIFLWLLVVLCFLFAAYACLVTFCVFSAVFCPPLQETRFLEKLANCSVLVVDSNNDWEVEVPAYTKYAAQDLKAQSKSDRVRVTKYGTMEEVELEFTVKELRQACKTGQLAIP